MQKDQTVQESVHSGDANGVIFNLSEVEMFQEVHLKPLWLLNVSARERTSDFFFLEDFILAEDEITQLQPFCTSY